MEMPMVPRSRRPETVKQTREAPSRENISPDPEIIGESKQMPAPIRANSKAPGSSEPHTESN